MAIRLSGLSSNLDTESIVQSLVSAYSVSKNNLEKSQTKLSWKKESWKTINTKLYSFYSKNLSNMKISSSFNKKTSSVSDSTIAKVTASASAVSGTQSLKVDKLAASGYLTGGEITTQVAGTKISLTTKLNEISGLSSFTDGAVSVGAGEKSTTVNMTKDMTVGGLVAKFKEAGVNASFDEINQRFFVSAKSSGADNDFTLTGADSGGLSALQSFGLYTVNSADTAEYTKWANYTPEEITTIKSDTYDAAKTTFDKVAAEYKNIYNTANEKVTTLTATNVQLSTEKADLLVERDNALLTADDIVKIDEQIAAIDKKITDNTASIDTNKTTMENNKQFVIFENDPDAAAKTANIDNQVIIRNDAIKANVEQAIDDKVATATAALAVTTDSVGAIRTVGKDSQITLNDAIFTSSTNNFQVNGLTIQALSQTPLNTSVSVTTDTDVDGIYKMVKDFFKGYNDLINSMDAAYNADSSGGYEPLTSDEKEKMTDTEIEKWETKIKGSLLRKDSTLSGVINSMKTKMLGGFPVDGKKYTLSSFGIGTLSYFTATENEKGSYHIDGDTEDTNTSGKTDKLRAAIASDPEAVTGFLTQLASSVYTDLTNRMKSSTIRSAYTIYNDKQMDTEYSQYSTKISGQETKISTMEDYYYKKFTAMESALSRLNSNTSSLSSLLGS